VANLSTSLVRRRRGACRRGSVRSGPGGGGARRPEYTGRRGRHWRRGERGRDPSPRFTLAGMHRSGWR
jgi:hypothetical protein